MAKLSIPIELLQVDVRVQQLISRTRTLVARSRAPLPNNDPLGRDGEPWTPEEDALLGSDTDRAISAKLRRSSVSVSNRRVKLGIPAKKKTGRKANPA